MSKPLLQLVMIVKNSGKEIIRMLEASKPFIDNWTILDTGSTDGTQERIKEVLKGVPGNLYEEPFVDFSYSRNRALDLAGKKCEWNIMLDDTYEIRNGKELRLFLKKKTKKVNSVLMFVNDEKNKYPSLRLSRSSCGYRYKYRIHEYLDAKNPTVLDENISFLFDFSTDFMKQRTSERQLSDYKMLKEDFEKNPRDQRLCYYLAVTCRNLGRYTESNAYYNKIIDEDNDMEDKNESEIYDSHLALFYYKLNNENNITEDDILKFVKKYPNHIDVINIAVIYYYQEKKYEDAFFYASKYYSYTDKQINDKIQLYNKSLENEILFGYINLAILTNRINLAIELLKKTLAEYPDSIPFNNIKNAITLPYILPKNLEKKVFVINAGGKGFVKWDPEKITNTNVSGSEIMAINMAEQFVNFGFRSFVFGNFNFERKVVNDVEYINYDMFIEFCNNYVIDLLIASRTSENIYYSHSVKQVYLWLHDIDICSAFKGYVMQTHKDKFKKVLCLTEWHKKFMCENKGIKEDMVHVTRNGIKIERFLNINDSVKKQPLRFIYSSCPKRGLDRLILLFPKIREKYPSAELYLFCLEDRINPNTFKLIKNTEGVIYNTRVSQEQLAIELKKSDIWLHPTNFLETYCITAVEAQMSEVLCVTSDIGSLSEIVGSRGITFPENTTDEDILKKLFFVIENPELKNKLVKNAKEWAMKQDIESLGKEWLKIFEEK